MANYCLFPFLFLLVGYAAMLLKSPGIWTKIVENPTQFALDHVHEHFRILHIQKDVPKLENTVGYGRSTIPPAIIVSGVNIKNIIKRLHGKKCYATVTPTNIAHQQQQQQLLRRNDMSYRQVTHYASASLQTTVNTDKKNSSVRGNGREGETAVSPNAGGGGGSDVLGDDEGRGIGTGMMPCQVLAQLSSLDHIKYQKELEIFERDLGRFLTEIVTEFKKLEDQQQRHQETPPPPPPPPQSQNSSVAATTVAVASSSSPLLPVEPPPPLLQPQPLNDAPTLLPSPRGNRKRRRRQQQYQGPAVLSPPENKKSRLVCDQGDDDDDYCIDEYDYQQYGDDDDDEYEYYSGTDDTDYGCSL